MLTERARESQVCNSTVGSLPAAALHNKSMKHQSTKRVRASLRAVSTPARKNEGGERVFSITAVGPLSSIGTAAITRWPGLPFLLLHPCTLHSSQQQGETGRRSVCRCGTLPGASLGTFKSMSRKAGVLRFVVPGNLVDKIRSVSLVAGGKAGHDKGAERAHTCVRQQ